jgi:molybdenum cofactor biosynthesis enzyme MoaA
MYAFHAVNALTDALHTTHVCCSLQVQRQPLLSKYLVIREGEQQLRKAFKSPAPGAPAQSHVSSSSSSSHSSSSSVCCRFVALQAVMCQSCSNISAAVSGQLEGCVVERQGTDVAGRHLVHSTDKHVQ